MTPTPEAREREAQDKCIEVVASATTAFLCGGTVPNMVEAFDAYRTAVRAALVAEIVVGVQQVDWLRPGKTLSGVVELSAGQYRKAVLTYLHGLAPETNR